jgi:hypothetical protein
MALIQHVAGKERLKHKISWFMYLLFARIMVRVYISPFMLSPQLYTNTEHVSITKEICYVTDACTNGSLTSLMDYYLLKKKDVFVKFVFLFVFLES